MLTTQGMSPEHARQLDGLIRYVGLLLHGQLGSGAGMLRRSVSRLRNGQAPQAEYDPHIDRGPFAVAVALLGAEGFDELSDDELSDRRLLAQGPGTRIILPGGREMESFFPGLTILAGGAAAESALRVPPVLHYAPRGDRTSYAVAWERVLPR